MYLQRKKHKSKIGGVEAIEGEPIEHKMERILNNKEPITDGAPEIYTERKDGVGAEYNIRTDRWEIATDAMDKVSANMQAKRDAKAEARKEKKEAKVVKLEPKKDKDSGAESTNGTSDS
tara:strand:+ start:1380 stop:1736 length:357 start_codon:yes stop_codon:yes gene_type:complete